MTLRHPAATLGVALCALLWSACAPCAEIVVSAAASLTDALRDIGKRFEAVHPGDQVVFNFAASDVLLAQIDKGAPVDVFASADEQTMDRAARAGRIVPATRRDFAANRLVIVVPKGALPVTSIGGLADAAVRRVAIGSPATVPAGRYARAALGDAWEALQPKLVRGQNVRQVLDYVARGEVDAGLVYETDAAIVPDRVSVTARIPLARPVHYPIAVVAGSREARLAATFVEFVTSAAGVAILERYGFMATMP